MGQRAPGGINMLKLTFIFSDVLQCEGQAGIFPLDDADLAEGASSDDPKKLEMIQVHCPQSQSALTGAREGAHGGV